MPVSAVVHITKMAAAQRQLDAAIRMTFFEEDELAIHTLAAAAYTIIRDIKRKRGRRELSDQLMRSILYMARDLVSGSLRELPPDIAASKELETIILSVAQKIRLGTIKNKDDVQIGVLKQETAYWRQFNKTANFLKHADMDSDGLLRTDELRNDDLIMGACASYIDLGGRVTPEMAIFHDLICFNQSEFLPTEVISKLRTLRTRSSRARYCRRFLQSIRR